MCHLREKYWTQLRNIIRYTLRKRLKCQRLKAEKCKTIPGLLSKDRVRDASVFEAVEYDLAGPLYLKDGRKFYIVMHTCEIYCAEHLELVTS